jgi:leucyl/phenylalanyl-tRNA--protein transferase
VTERFFPDPRDANEFGVVVAGASPHPELLKEAYASGIFPWPHRGYPLLWFSPDPRFVLPIGQAHLHRSLQKELRRTELVIKADTAFRDVMAGCAKARRDGQGTWITREMIRGYCALHDEGLCHSVEAWRGDVLVGGLYGVSLGGMFFGESMFTVEPNASKIAFATLLGNLHAWGFDLVDCQAYTDHLARFGAVEWPRARFLDELAARLAKDTVVGRWEIALQPALALERLKAHGIGS